jgi:hypothetical protein
MDRFADGSEPLIGECEVAELPATILVGGGGIIVDIDRVLGDTLVLEVEYGPLAFALRCEAPEAVEVALALPRRLRIATLEAAGFEML